MPPIPAGRFRSVVAALRPDERLALVADAWAECGWETRIEDGLVVAERDGEIERIAVVDDTGLAGRLGLAGRNLDTSATAVLTTAGTDRMRARAADAGLAVRTADNLRERLLYGLDRETASAVFERHVGRGLEATPEELEAAAGGGADTWRDAAGGPIEWLRRTPVRSADDDSPLALTRRSATAVLLAALLVTVAVGSGIGPGTFSRTDSTVTTPREFPPTASPTEPRFEYPPGLSPSGLEDVAALATAHLREIRRSGRSFTMVVRFDGPATATGWGEATRLRQRVVVENRDRFRVTQNRTRIVNGDRRNTTTDVFYRNGTRYQWVRGPDGTWRNRDRNVSPDSLGGIVEDGAPADEVYRYFVGAETNVTCTTVRSDGSCGRFRIVATDVPFQVLDAATDYTATLRVTGDGRVVSLNVFYSLSTANGTAEPVMLSMTFSAVGNTSVTRPAWVDSTGNGTGPVTGTETAAPTES